MAKFDTASKALYTIDDLFNGFDPLRPETYKGTPDFQIYLVDEEFILFHDEDDDPIEWPGHKRPHRIKHGPRPLPQDRRHQPLPRSYQVPQLCGRRPAPVCAASRRGRSTT